MSRAIKLVGLDCGSTTTSAVVASARLTKGALGRVEITSVEPIFRSPVVFTPFAEDQLDAPTLDRYLDEWLTDSGLAGEEIFGGGALVTGLAAQQSDAAAIVGLIERRMADSVVATAGDPALESWLAFMGNCHALSKAHPSTTVLNLDIGGGTTNLAWGRDGQVSATACLLVGARHFRFAPGTYQLAGLSPYAKDLLAGLKIDRDVGHTLAEDELDAILAFYVKLIVAAIEWDTSTLSEPIAARHVQLWPKTPTTQDRDAHDRDAVITLSGGVGQLAYEQLRGETDHRATRFGDLGGELASRIIRTPGIAGRMGGLVPDSLGRATVYGLLQHSTELSGSTLYLPRPETLPLKNIPIVGRINAATSEDQLTYQLGLAARSGPAGCLQVELEQPELELVRDLGNRLANQIERLPWPADRTLVLLTPENSGKTLGNYVTRWGTLEAEVIVVDEVPLADAQFVRLGRPREGVVPLWLYASG